MSEKFESFGVEAEIREGERNRFAVWNLGEIVFPDGTVKITAVTNEAKEQEGHFGSLPAAVYRLQNSRLMQGTVNAIARRATRNYTADGVQFTVNAVVRGLAGDRQITRSVKVADNGRRNMAGAANELARQVAESVATSAYVYLNEKGWKPASQQAEEPEQAEESLV